jgi:hypothetical protein
MWGPGQVLSPLWASVSPVAEDIVIGECSLESHSGSLVLSWVSGASVERGEQGIRRWQAAFPGE